MGLATGEKSWVLRTGAEVQGKCMYLAIERRKVCWTWKVEEALRFSRREDAEAYRDTHVTGLGAVSDAEAEEHEFIS